MWDEKYRPKTLDEVVGQYKVVRYFKSAINNGGDINHCIFHGNSGTGKTTIANIVANELKVDLIGLNASDDRGIVMIRKKVIEAMRCSSFKGKYKIIFLDETESLMADAMNCLKRPMEVYKDIARVFFSCNDDSNIIEPIKSRCTDFQFIPISKEDMVKRLKFIAEKEELDFGPDCFEYIVKKAHGDMRKAVNLLEQLKNQGFEADEFGLFMG